MRSLTPLQIISLIQFKTNERVTDWATAHGWSKSQIYGVIKGARKNGEIRALIAKTIGRPVDELWPADKNKTAHPLGGPLP